MTDQTSPNLFVKDHAFPCTQGAECKDATVEFHGRFFIVAGHENFNSKANNANGYATRARALAAIRKLHGTPRPA